MEDLEAYDLPPPEAAANAIEAIERMTDAQVCRHIQNETYTGTKFICLSGGQYGCSQWSDERVGKDSFIVELNRRYGGAEDCESIARRLEQAEDAPTDYVLLDSTDPAYCLMYGFSEIEFLLKIKQIPRDQLVRMTLDINQLKRRSATLSRRLRYRKRIQALRLSRLYAEVTGT